MLAEVSLYTLMSLNGRSRTGYEDAMVKTKLE